MGGSSPTTGYKYFMDLHFIAGLARGGSKLASAVKDGLMKISAGDRIAWRGLVTANGSIYVNAPDLFGGDQKEGGLDGSLEIMFGGPDQMPNTYLSTAFPGTNPGYRNVFSAIYKQGQVACNNPYIKAWSFLRRRITGDWYGGDCWYESKAPIPLADSTPGASPGGPGIPAGFGFNVGQQVNVIAPVLESQMCTLEMAVLNGYDYAEVPDSAFWFWRENESGLCFIKLGHSDESAVLELLGDGWVIGDTALMKFNSGQLTMVVLTSSPAPPLGFGEYVWNAGNGGLPIATEADPVYFWTQPLDFVGLNAPSGGGDSGAPARYCMNPAHVIYQVLTDPDVGLGYPSAIIDEDSFTAAADQLYAEGLGVNLRWTNPTSIEDFISIVLDHAGGALVKDRRTGLFKLRLLRKDYNIEDLPVFNPDNCRITGSAQRPTPADSVNELQVTYTDYRDGKEKTVPVRNSAAIAAAGGVVTSKSHSLTGLPTAELAGRRGMMDLDAMSLPLWRFELTFLRDADTLEPAEPFVLDWPPLGIQIVMRVAGDIDYGNAADGDIRAACVEDVFALPDAVYSGTLPEPNTGNPGDPLATTALVMEVPYIDLARNLTPADLAALPADAGYVGSVAKRPASGHLHYQLATRIDPIAFAEVARGDFAPSATLSADIAPGQFEVPLTGWTDLRGVGVGKVGYLGPDGATAEMVRFDAIAIDGTTATLGRGCGDTIPSAWPAGTRLWCHEGYETADPAQYIAGETVDAKVLPRTSNGQLALANAATLPVTMDERFERPYIGGDFRLNSVSIYEVGTATPGGGGGGGGAGPTSPPALGGNGAPASQEPGPNGGFPDDAPYPVPLPDVFDEDVIPDGGFDDPGSINAWRKKDGSPLGSDFSLLDGGLHHIGGGTATAYCYGARKSLPFMPLPILSITVTADLITDPSVVSIFGIAEGSANGSATPYPQYIHSAPATSYPTLTPVSYTWTRRVPTTSNWGASGYSMMVFMPVVEHVSALGTSNAKVDNVTMTITEVPTPMTAESPDHLDFDAGFTGWTMLPDPAGTSPYTPTMAVSGGEVSMTPISPYFTHRWLILDAPITSLDEIGKILEVVADVWSNDDTVVQTSLGTFTTGGVALGLATKLPGQEYQPFTTMVVSRGDWTERKAYLQAALDESNAPGVTNHLAVLMQCAVGKTSKFRNPALRVTDAAHPL